MKLAKDLCKRDIQRYIQVYEQSWNTPEGMKDRETFAKIHKALLNKACLNSKQLYEVARWKTPRVSKIVENNPDSIVKRITALAFKIQNELYKIRLLCSLDGIGVLRASAILAMSDPQKYGIIDINAWLALTGKKNALCEKSPPATLQKVQPFDVVKEYLVQLFSSLFLVPSGTQSSS